MNCEKNHNRLWEIENKIKENLDKKICLLLMSGGIDSSACLVLLQQKWFFVIWVHYDYWNTYKSNKPNKCCNVEDLSDAQKIAKNFWISLFNLDYKEKFRKEIIAEFIEKKSKWIPYNPCTNCHKKIKYWEIFDLTKKYNCKIASGYYCKIENWELLKPKDEKKDQTFSIISDFDKNDLKFLEFPLWNYLKSEVREIAKKAWIEIFNKKDSMGLCFVWEKNNKEFIKNYCENKIWDIYFFDWKNEISKMWKKHKWLWLYEIWENSGFNKKINWEISPLFIYKKNIKENSLIISERKFVQKTFFETGKFNLFENFEWILDVQIKYNSNEKAISWKINLQNWILKVNFEEKINSLIPDQIFVIYSWEKALGWWLIQ